MKRLLLLPAFILGCSFACDLPHEEIEGFKLGCPYTGDLSAGTTKDHHEKIVTYEQRLENSFFDSAEITVVEGTIESLTLSKTFHDLNRLKEDRTQLWKSLNERWGDAVVMGDNEGLILYVNNNPQSQYLNAIVVMSTFIESAGILQTIYSSKPLND